MKQNEARTGVVCEGCLKNHSIASIQVFLLMRNEIGALRQEVDLMKQHINSLYAAQQDLEVELTEGRRGQ